MRCFSVPAIALAMSGCHSQVGCRSVVVMAPHEGEYLWVAPESRNELGSGGELQIYMDPEAHPEAALSFAKFTLGVGGALPVHRHHKTEEISYFLSGEGAVVFLDEDGDEREIPVSAGFVWYNPPGVWHAVRNTGAVPLSLVFAIVPNEEQGLLSYFRRVSAGPGKEAIRLSPDELGRIASEHDLIIRTPPVGDE